MPDCRAADFFLPESLHYLNCAYMAPMARVVEEAGIAGIRMKRNPAAVTPDDFFDTVEEVRRRFARIVNAPSAHDVAIVPSVSYGIATATANLALRRDQTIVLLHEQFPSNVYSWMRAAKESGARIRVVDPPDSDRGRQWNLRILEAIGPDTGAVAVPHVHWADGTCFDLEAIGRRAREVGAALIVDGTQSVGALPFDVEKVRPDALVCAGYKWLLGPYSIGMAWFGERFLNGRPLEENWIAREDSRAFSRLVSYRDAYGPGATRFDVGERSNFILIPMMNAALGLIESWGPRSIQQYCAELSADAVESLRSLGFRIEDPAYRASHLFGVRLPDHMDVDRTRQSLADRGISVSVRGDAIRVAPNVYNRPVDMEALVDTLAVPA